MTNKTVIQALSVAEQARVNCGFGKNPEWAQRWSDYLHTIVKECLPSGAGVDNGTKLKSYGDPNEIVLSCEFHHMNEDGFYNGWTEHTITVRPTFTGISLSISGPNKNDIKDYLYELYETALTAELPTRIVP